ncbi:FAD:protein FMN transferase [Nocardioides bruguierae]|uniref:FAD:protein FMN transferase n=1 Tax=Nocardioides bruguierae TaxID=2945102 RepID=UPI00202090C5|nr:FAD:protein FMN transferase [Nocardioides bruguierae]MCL8025024.1 FAD:protein FMN transferase [Nocardioides bruguierae]
MSTLLQRPVAAATQPAPVVAGAAASWRALGTTVEVRTERPDEIECATTLLGQVLTDVAEVASRFDPDSDLSRVNAAAGHWVEVDPLLVSAVRVALDAAAATDGLVHPLLGRPMIELGYDADLTQVRRRGELTPLPHTPAPAPAVDAWEDVALREEAVRIPAGTALDLGATAKAWCTDLALAAFRAAGLHRALVSSGGDLRTHGPGAWTVRVAERPGDGPEAGRTQLVDATGALATSSVLERRWRTAGTERHHLLDPRTGQPLTGPWRTATVAAPTTVLANVAATQALVLGHDALAHLHATGLAARLVDHSGRVTAVNGWPTTLLTDPSPDGDPHA